MPVKIGPKHQITMPKKIFTSLHLNVGNIVDSEIMRNIIVLIPKKLVPKDQEWFWIKEWQEKEKETDEALKRVK